MFGLRRKNAKQWVCTVCGYNMVGQRPAVCPFCGARKDRIYDSDAISRRYRIQETPVTAAVTQLKSAPKLGLEHAAYRVEGDGGAVMIDCPSVFADYVPRADAILFTHKDFIGAANQYRDAWDAEVWLHAADAELSEVAQHSVTQTFAAPFEKFGIEGIPIGGHSPGFTVYVWKDVLFVCDYAYPPGNGMKLNPHGNRDATREGASRLADVVAERTLTKVCGYNYTVDFADWHSAFARLI